MSRHRLRALKIRVFIEHYTCKLAAALQYNIPARTDTSMAKHLQSLYKLIKKHNQDQDFLPQLLKTAGLHALLDLETVVALWHDVSEYLHAHLGYRTKGKSSESKSSSTSQ